LRSDYLTALIGTPHRYNMQRVVERIHQIADLIRFCEVTKEAGFQATGNVIGERVGRQRNDRDVTKRRFGTQYTQYLEPADARQVDIHQNHFRQICFCHDDAKVAVYCCQQFPVGASGKQLHNQRQVCRMILDIQEFAESAVSCLLRKGGILTRCRCIGHAPLELNW